MYRTRDDVRDLLKKSVWFTTRFFKKVNADVLLESEFDVDFDGQMMIKFSNCPDGSVMAVNGINGYGINIIHEIAFKDAEIYFPQ